MDIFLRTEHTWTKGVQERPWAFTCDVQGCYWSTSHRTILAALDTRVTHICPFGGGTTLSAGKTLMAQTWERLDEITKMILEGRDLPEAKVSVLRAEARGVAWCLQLWCTPFYADVAAVSREAVRRYRMDTGILEHSPSPHEVTPSADHPDWQPRGKFGSKVTGARGTSTHEEVKPSRVFSEQDRTMIKSMKSAGLPIESIARAVKATVTEVRAV